MVCGAVPFRAKSMEELNVAVMKAELLFPDGSALSSEV
jgi:hypothetical protein